MMTTTASMNNTDHPSGSSMKTSVNLVIHNKEEEEGGDVQPKKIPQHTCGNDDAADPGSDAGDDENYSVVRVQQCQRLKLKILKTKLENDLACKYYSKRQFAMLFLPLSCIGMLVSIVGFADTGPGPDPDCDKSIDFVSLAEGLFGAIIVFLSNLVRSYVYIMIMNSIYPFFILFVYFDTVTPSGGFYYMVVAANSQGTNETTLTVDHVVSFGLLLFVIINYMWQSKNLNFDAKAEHHQVVASQMKWLVDNADMLCHNISSTTQDGKSRKNNNTNDIDNKFKKLEEHFHMAQQSVPTVLPIKIAVAFRTLEYDLKLSRSIQNKKLVAGYGGGDDDDKDDDHLEDCAVWNSYTELCYMELATILGERIYWLPNPKVSARMAIQNAKKMYMEVLDESTHIGTIR